MIVYDNTQELAENQIKIVKQAKPGPEKILLFIWWDCKDCKICCILSYC